MGKKLLNKTLWINLIFSGIVILIAFPLFYFVIQRLYIQETDESLNLKKEEFIKYFQNNFKVQDINSWNKINRTVQISKNHNNLLHDTFVYYYHYDSLAQENEYSRVLYSPVRIENGQYLITARVSLVESKDFIENIGFIFLATLFILLAGFYFITKRLSNKLWKPFYDSLSYLEQFEIDKSPKSAIHHIDIEEFERLNQAILKLTVRNTKIYQSQREFVENAAHELQTPLAVFQAKIDTLMQYSDVTEEQSVILTQLNEAAARLNKLNRNLLLLSKIESNQFSETEIVDFHEAFQKVLSFFEEQALSRNISIDIQLLEIVKVKSNHVLVEVLISNLFLNAIRHNVQNGTIIVCLTKEKLTFSNTGINTPLNQTELFQRFAKANPSSNGNGLGLAIIKQIVMINGWDISYHFNNGLHTFEVHF